MELPKKVDSLFTLMFCMVIHTISRNQRDPYDSDKNGVAVDCKILRYTNTTQILETTDSGSQWTEQTTPTKKALYAVDFVDINTGFAVGIGGTILKTIDGGIKWTLQSSGASGFLYGLDFLDGQHGWVVGENGTILSTNDAGLTEPS